MTDGGLANIGGAAMDAAVAGTCGLVFRELGAARARPFDEVASGSPIVTGSPRCAARFVLQILSWLSSWAYVRVLFIIENSSVPGDSRVWQESRTLAGAGHEVVVVCPQEAPLECEPFEHLEGVAIHRYPSLHAEHFMGYLFEYSWAFWHIRRLARRLARDEPFDVVHAGNPPDFLLLATRSLKRDGTRFIFDHHDLVPELYGSRFIWEDVLPIG